ncbi:MAG: efflux RND transporter permease subunit [Gammaproteobacteria bacterium]|nr:efflux RND transporter permease subunit [Gammaproteobacteria bacterium]
MTLPELSIKRHALAFSLSAAIMLFGLVSASRIGMDRIPDIDLPIISVLTTLPGANPEIVDSSITSLLESAVNSVAGIKYIASDSQPGRSTIMMMFYLKKDVDVAFNEVQSKVNQVLPLLPEDIDPPVVAKLDFAASPVIWLALQGDRTLQELNQYADKVIKKRLENIDGVGEVKIYGEQQRTIRINADLARMAALSITAQDIVVALAREHVQLPGGFLVGSQTEYLIKLDQEFHNARSMRQLIVGYRDGAPIRLADISVVDDALSDKRQSGYFLKEPSIAIGVVKVSTGNAVAVVDEVLRRMDEELIPNLPPGMTLGISANEAKFTKELIAALEEHLILGTLLAALVVLVFLRDWRSTLIVATAIPVSLLGAVAVMYFFGYTFNTFTMLALLLLIGVVVDDAIVVLENIHRHIERYDANPFTAAISGTSQVYFAVFAATMSLVCIFAPAAFTGGVPGQFFKSFSVVVTMGVLVSFFVAITLTPMLCSRYLKVGKPGALSRRFGTFFDGMDSVYKRLLGLALRHRLVTVIGAALLVIFGSAYCFANIGKGFMADQDEGRFLVFFRTPVGSSIEYTEQKMHRIEEAFASYEIVQDFWTGVASGGRGQVNQGIAWAQLIPMEEREMSQQELVRDIQKKLSAIPGVMAFASPISMVQQFRGEQLQFNVNGPNLARVGELATELNERLSKDPSIAYLDLDMQMDLPQLTLDIDRERAASLGLSTLEITQAVNLLLGGMDIAYYNDDPGDGERYDVRLKAQEAQITGPEALSKIYLRSSAGELVRADTVASFVQGIGPAIINRFNLRYSANFYGTPATSLDASIRAINEAAEEFPLGYGVDYIGQAADFQEMQTELAITMGMALILLYMVLASQFNSFIQPLIIMLAQPLAVAGALFALWLFDLQLMIYSGIALILLVGLVAKNSILLVDLTNQLRDQGHEIDAALREACPIRMRPVLMTSMTLILAMLPAAVGVGAGAESNQPMAIAIIGGMISSTLLTLVVVPAMYSLVEGWLARFAHRQPDMEPKPISPVD